MKLALGTVQFGLNYGIANNSGRINPQEARSILRHALESGMDTLDTAISYGESESVLGSMGIQAWKVVTKLPPIPEDCRDVGQWINKQVLDSIQRLGVTRLHGLLLHRPSQLLEDKGPSLYAALQAVKRHGLASKIGVSVYGPEELDPLFQKYTFDLVQAPLNIIDRSLVDSGWAHQLKKSGIEVHTRSAFLQGLLLIPADKRPAKFSAWTDIWVEWDRWLSASNLSALQACLRYVNTLDCIDRVVVGVDSGAQLKEIIQAADGKLESLPKFNPMQDDRLINPASWNQL